MSEIVSFQDYLDLGLLNERLLISTPYDFSQWLIFPSHWQNNLTPPQSCQEGGASSTAPRPSLSLHHKQKLQHVLGVLLNTLRSCADKPGSPTELGAGRSVGGGWKPQGRNWDLVLYHAAVADLSAKEREYINVAISVQIKFKHFLAIH